MKRNKRSQHRKSSRKHQWLRERNAQGAFVVLRVDDYATHPSDRGQFYPANARSYLEKQNGGSAIWPSYDKAEGAAKWATERFGHKYAVFQMVAFVEHVTAPIKVARVK